MLNNAKTDKLCACGCVIHPQELTQNFKLALKGVVENVVG